MLRLSSSHVVPDLLSLLSAFSRHRAEPGPSFARRAQDALDEAHALIEPAAVWAWKECHAEEPFLPPDLPASLSTQAENLIGVVCTIGEALERRSRQWFAERQYTRGYLLDRVGTLSVATLARKVADLLSAEHNVARWAPGDARSDQALATQRALFSWVPAGQIGVRLSEHNVMIPAKSLSFVLLVGENLADKRCVIPCDRCVWNGTCKSQRGG